MANLLGDGFNNYVRKQINNRQKVFGSKNRTTSEIAYLNSRTAWVKMASSVSVNNKRLQKIGLKGIIPEGIGLAKKFILFNGTSELFTNSAGQKGKFIQRSGINYNNNSFNNNSAYGLGGNDFGIVPMPGIIDLSVDHAGTRGSLRKASITFKAYNREQFDIIDVLYLRLGFTVLIEWGFSKYINNSGDIENMGSTLMEEKFFSSKFSNKTYLELLPEIEKKRYQYGGNYDALFGRITNFKWNFEPDGSYSIRLDLYSLGDLAESLTVNIASNKDPIFSELNSEDSKSDDEIGKNIIDDYFTDIRNSEYFVGLKRPIKTAVRKNLFGNIINFQPEWPSLGIYPKTSPTADLFNANYADPKQSLYVRFGTFLGFLRDEVIYKFKSSNNIIKENDISDTPILDIDNDLESNVMYTIPNQLSLDPRICIINNVFAYSSVGKDLLFEGLEKFFNPDPYFGKVMNIYLNTGFISGIIKNNTNKEGFIAIYDLLSEICNNLNRVLGGVNNLEPVIDETTNCLKIVDSSKLPNVKEITSYLLELNKNKYSYNTSPFTYNKNTLSDGSIKYSLNLFGYKNKKSESNFIHNISLGSSVSKNTATMLAIGAAAGSGVIGTESTSFSKWNEGIEDRYNNNLQNAQGNDTPDKTVDEKFEKVIEGYAKFLNENFSSETLLYYGGSPIPIEEPKDKSINSSVTTLNTLDNNLIEKNLQRGYEFNNYLIVSSSIANSNSTSGQPGFLPLELQIDMEGISGIKIYQKVNIDTSFLPSNYPETLDFLSVGLSHILKDNKWQTTLSTQATTLGNKNKSLPLLINLNPVLEKSESIPPPKGLPTPNIIPEILNSSNSPKKSKSLSSLGFNANKLRSTLAELGYKEKGVEIDNGGDITPQLERAASAVFKKIKELYPSYQIIVTGGNDYYHTTLTYVSRHIRGRGLDFVITPSGITEIDNVLNILKGFAAGNYPNFRFIDEYRSPTKAATAKHFHISVGPGTEAKQTIDQAKKEADLGTLTTYNY
jgi:hypothetical protein